MKFKRYAKMKTGLQTFDMVPMLDVFFLLVIFYLLASAFTFFPNIDVKLPTTVTSDDVAEKNIVITITSENVIYWRNKIVSVKDLRDQLSQVSKKNSSILIKADRRVSLGRIVDVWDLCRAVGVERVNIATDRDQ